MGLLYFVDEAQFWGWKLIPYCKRLIQKEKIFNVIASGAPFMTNYWASRLKTKLPDINLIQDFRDPWNDNPFYPYLLPRFRDKSKHMESYSLQNCDCLITVTNGLLELLRKQLVEEKKCVVVYNGYDNEYEISLKKVKRNFSLLYSGNLGLGRAEVLNNLLEIVLDRHKEFPEIRLIFYGKFPKNLNNKYAYLIEKGILQINKYVSPTMLRQKIHFAFMGLQINSPVFPYALSSKIFEYISIKRPVLSINGGGEIDSLIKDNNFGDSINYRDDQGILAALKKWYTIWQMNPDFELRPDSIERFSYKELVRKIEQLLL